jgi:hypothetical protein
MKIGDITLKQDYLTGGQVGNLVTEAIEIYKQGGLFKDYAFNPVDMEINFYAGLFYLLIEDYKIDDNEQFEELFKKGVHKEILEKVTNAQLAYDLMWKTAREIGNSIGSILNKIDTFIGNLPENEKLDELMEKLPAEWQTVKKEYEEITGQDLSNKGDKE